MRLVLARHGETPANVEGVLDTLPPGPGLTALGEAQSQALADELAALPITAVYASTARRTQLTAARVAAPHGLAVQVVAGVHEVFVGELEGCGDPESIRRFWAVDRAWHDGSLDVALPGGESARDVLRRHLRVVRGIRAAHPAGTAVLVGHGGALRIAAAVLGGGVPARAGNPARSCYLRNCGRIVLESESESESESDGAGGAGGENAADGWRVVEWRPEPPGGLGGRHSSGATVSPIRAGAAPLRQGRSGARSRAPP